MPQYVALLRGIAPMNPNMRNEKLRGVFEDLGFTNVRSVISSGNVLFESPKTDITKLEAMLEEAWPAQLGFTSTTMVRSLSELKQLVAADPFPGLTHSPKTSLNVTFLKHKPDDIVKLEGRGFTIPAMFNREICSIIDLTSAKTPDFMAKVERAYGKEMTTRTWKTVERIVKLLES